MPAPVSPFPKTPYIINYPSGLTLAMNTGVTANGRRKLVWCDDFDSGVLDPDRWFAETGDGSQYGLNGWGNDELQWYLPRNVQLLNNHLVITARKESQNGFSYCSGKIITRDRFAFCHGRIEARIRLPGGQGLWPALWLMPQNNKYGTWAASGEIDVVEAVNLDVDGNNDIHATIHYGGIHPHNLSSDQSFTLASSASENFHVYALEWEQYEMRWYVDDMHYFTKNNWSTHGAAYPAPFDQPFYILLNVAVGGTWPGSPDSSTIFPVSMEVDFIRVYSGD